MGRRKPRFYIDCMPMHPFVGDTVMDGALMRLSVYARKPHRKGRWIDSLTCEEVEMPYTPRKLRKPSKPMMIKKRRQ